MKIEEKKELLKKYRSIAKEYDSAWNTYIQFHRMIENTCVLFDHDASSRSGFLIKNTKTQNPKHLENLILRLSEYQNTYKQSLNKLLSFRLSIEKAIENIPEAQYRHLLRLKYIDLKSWEQVAIEMDYDFRHIHRLHQKALHAIEIHTSSSFHI